MALFVLLLFYSPILFSMFLLFFFMFFLSLIRTVVLEDRFLLLVCSLESLLLKIIFIVYSCWVRKNLLLSSLDSYRRSFDSSGLLQFRTEENNHGEPTLTSCMSFLCASFLQRNSSPVISCPFSVYILVASTAFFWYSFSCSKTKTSITDNLTFSVFSYKCSALCVFRVSSFILGYNEGLLVMAKGQEGLQVKKDNSNHSHTKREVHCKWNKVDHSAQQTR